MFMLPTGSKAEYVIFRSVVIIKEGEVKCQYDTKYRGALKLHLYSPGVLSVQYNRCGRTRGNMQDFIIHL